MSDEDTRELRRAVARGAMRSLRIIGDDLHGTSQDRAPLDEGTLRASGEVVFIINGLRHEGAGAFEAALRHAVGLAAAGDLRSMNVEVSYNTIYAARQHEELDWKHPRGGQAKYLESVIHERGARWGAVISAEQRRALS